MKRGTPEDPSQQLIPFDSVSVDSVSPPLPATGRYEPTEQALEAFERLEGWLCTVRGPVTDVAAEALYALARALLEGHWGYFHKAEDCLEVLKLRNGKTEGDDIAEGIAVHQNDNFQATVEHCLEALHEMMLCPGMAR